MTAAPALLIPGLDDIIADAEAFEPPQFWPRDHDAAASVVYRLARRWAVQIAYGHIDADTAYVYARMASETLQVHTAGHRRWRDTMPFLTWIIDTTSARLVDHLLMRDDRAYTALKATALQAISRGGTDLVVRDVVATAAEQMAHLPPEEVLHQAYHDAIAEARRNARWMNQREAPRA